MKATDMNYSDLNENEKYRLKVTMSNPYATHNYGDPAVTHTKASSLPETIGTLFIVALMVVAFYVAMPEVAAQLWHGLLEAIELIEGEMK